jgi:hypothetical protein
LRLTARPSFLLGLAQFIGLGALERVLGLFGRGLRGARLHVAPYALAIFPIGGAVALTSGRTLGLGSARRVPAGAQRLLFALRSDPFRGTQIQRGPQG